MKITLFRTLILFVIILVFALPAMRASAKEGDVLVVSPQGPYTSISAALDVAVDGDRIEVHGGQYSGPLVVDKSVSLEGVDWPVIDGNSQGTVVKLTGPGTHFKGFVIRNSGASLDEENSGIAGEAPNLIIENNHLENTLFGIYLREAPGSNIRNNIIQSKDLDLARRGDPIRAWYSNDVLIAENKVEKGRDVVLWYSENLTVRDNTITEGRYGLHFMYCDDATITNNLLAYNSVGTFMMYSRRLKLIHNTIAYNHGPSGFGIGLKDMDDAIVQDNLFLANRVGAHLDNSPREVDSTGTYQGNVFAYNDIGVNLMPSVRHNQFSDNSFIENQDQVNIGGGGMTQDNLWTVDGLGNFWSDYAGYDQAGDGLGDEVYRADRLFENLTSRYPNLRLFIFSPSSQAVDFAAKAVPFVRPQPKLTDSQPLMAPVFPTNLPALPQDPDNWFLWVSVGLILLASIVFLGGAGLLPTRLKKPGPLPNPPQRGIPKDQKGNNPLIQVKQLTKRFKGLTVVDQLSFEIITGQAVALWGPNGAGKTTSLRCLIGLLPFDGEITVNGIDVRRQGKTVRKVVGFVPQELAFHDDLTVQETMKFYARLKGVPTPLETHIKPILARVDLSGHESKLIRELSGGLKQRLALGIALLADPHILVLDEPTSNLDVHARDDFLELLLELKASGMTLIFSSHRLEEIATLADRVLLLENGKLIADCPPDELSAQTGWNVTLRVLLEGRDLKPALDTLIQHGFVASPNGKGIRVKVTPGQKGRPLSVLTQAGIQVEDFEIEQLNGS
jgi:nitrous oxidase accessory protein